MADENESSSPSFTPYILIFSHRARPSRSISLLSNCIWSFASSISSSSDDCMRVSTPSICSSASSNLFLFFFFWTHVILLVSGPYRWGFVESWGSSMLLLACDRVSLFTSLCLLGIFFLNFQGIFVSNMLPHSSELVSSVFQVSWVGLESYSVGSMRSVLPSLGPPDQKSSHTCSVFFLLYCHGL